MKKITVITIFAVLSSVAVAVWLIKGKTDSVPVEGQPIVEITIPELSEIAQQGEKEFTENCATCHGINAVGKQGIAPPLVHIIYEPSHHGDASFILAAKNGVRAHHWPFGNMPPIEGVNDDQVLQIIEYVRELQRANGIF